MFEINPVNSLNAIMRNAGFNDCRWHHEFTKEDMEKYKDIIEYCEECKSPLIWSCCNVEISPEPEAGGFCPICKEHCF